MIKNKTGFTLIELLVVIVIIGVLAAFGYATFLNPPKQARDARRKSDIRQYQIALENYSTANGNLYPSYTDITGVDPSANTGLCQKLATFLPSCPSNGTYKYSSNGSNDGNANASSWVLWSQLEAVTNNWVICSNGRSGEMDKTGFALTTSGTCPLP